MKIQCDVCSRDEASAFCCADEAALCDGCNRRVHHANKLAEKHRRYSLSSVAETHPLCDICKERGGFVFCQEDRAILCTDCDESIHTANKLTMKHNRFILTGVRLSSTPVVELENKNNSNSFNGSSEQTNHNKSKVVEESVISSTDTPTSATSNATTTSSISEYLIKTLPGYRVEDFLIDDALTAADGFYKTDGMMPFSEPDLAVAEEFPIWVPHVPQIQPLNHLSSAAADGLVHNYNHGFEFKAVNQSQQYHGVKVVREQWVDDSFMVPQINTSVLSSKKRPRTSSAWDL